MSLSKMPCLHHFNSCAKSGRVLNKNIRKCKNINCPQSKRILLTSGSANIRNISYALKTASDDQRRSSIEPALHPPLPNSLLRRHQSIALNGIEEPDSDFNILPNIISSVKNMRKKIMSLFPAPTSMSDAKTQTITKPYQCMPGPKRLPVFGSALDYTFLGDFSPQEFDIALKKRHEKYGPIFREKIMNEEYVYVSNPKDIRMLAQNEGSTPCRPSLEVMVRSRTQEGLPVGITAMQGSEWLRNRIAINPVISLSKTVTKFRDAQRLVTKDFVKMMKQLQSKDTHEIENFEDLSNRWALESVAVVLLNTRLGLLSPSSQSTDSAAEGLRKCMDVFFDYGARLTFSLPTWKLWNTKDWKIFRKAQTDEFKFAGYFVEKKLKELFKEKTSKGSKSIAGGCPFHHGKKTNKVQDASCLLDHVINHSKLSKDEAVTVCLEMLAGGIDTTSTATIFTLYHLAKNPKHQEHLRSLLQDEISPEADEYNRETSKFSKYLKACVWESMRFNPLTYANARTTQKDLVLSGHSVPAGTQVRFTSHLMNLKNEDYFPEPEEFIPERWLDRNSPYRCKKQFTFTPFGHGPRQCPGRRVAEQELDLLFREILSNFRVGYKYEDIGVKVRLFNGADKPAKFEFFPLKEENET